MIKPENIKKKVDKIENILTRMENGQYTGETIGYVVDQIAWLYKYGHIDKEEMTKLTAHARYVIYLMGPSITDKM